MVRIAFILFPLFSIAQNVNQLHGSIIGAIICTDGIVIAADSRASFTAYNTFFDREIPYASIDSTQKIFSIGNFEIAISGNLNVGNTFWTDLLIKFNRGQSKFDSPDTTFNKFKYFVTKKLKINDTLLRGNIFILAGYENGKAFILFIDSINSKKYIRLHDYPHSAFSNPCFDPKVYFRPGQFSCDYISKSIANGYLKCSGDFTNGIGGPSTILKINYDNSVTKIASFKYKRWKTYLDLERAAYYGRINVIYHTPESKSILKAQLLSKMK
jgi:hypothetical protein